MRTADRSSGRPQAVVVIVNWIGLVLAAGFVVLLVVALLFAERF